MYLSDSILFCNMACFMLQLLHLLYINVVLFIRERNQIMFQTIAAIATPPGQGGIAIIRISGMDAYSIANRIFKPANKNKCITKAIGYSALFGTFVFENKVLDEGIALCFRAPHSYTGEDVIEFSCHGGSAVTYQLLLSCIQAGAQPAEAGEFTKRAVLNGRINLTQAEAVMDLIEATSKQAVAAAQAALSGVLYSTIIEEKQKLISLAGHLTAYIDYPEEGVEAIEKNSFIKMIDEVHSTLSSLINDYEKGSMIRHGIQTAIVGSPNVGKSTLFNLLSGFDRAIVTDIPGTTRDVVRESIQVAGISLNISDTAGLRLTDDIVEKEGIRRSYSEFEQASFVIAVFDGSKAFQIDEIELAMKCQNRLSLAIINKSDLGIKVKKEEISHYFTEILVLSIKEKDVKEEIEKSVIRILKLQDVSTNSAMLANNRQLSAAVASKNALEDARNAIKDGITLDAIGVCLEDAIFSLTELTGENVSEVVLSNVFDNFCVGK